MTNGYVAIPKTMRKFSEEKFGISHQRIGLIIFWVLLSIFLLIIAGKVDFLGRILFISLFIAIWIVYAVFLRTSEVLDRTTLTYKYFIRALLGQTVIAKYTAPVAFLEQVVPIRNFHKNGLIEFVDNRYGILLKVDPKRVSDDDLEAHIHKVKDMTDSLHGEMVLKTFVCSRSTTVKPLEKHLINTINSKGKTLQQKEHLYELYHEVHQNTAPVIEWQFYIFLGLGRHPTLEDAEISRQAHLPGFQDRLVKAGMHTIPMVNQYEASMAFRQCVMQMGVS
jgi:hypothetical protein